MRIRDGRRKRAVARVMTILDFGFQIPDLKGKRQRLAGRAGAVESRI